MFHSGEGWSLIPVRLVLSLWPLELRTFDLDPCVCLRNCSYGLLHHLHSLRDLYYLDRLIGLVIVFGIRLLASLIIYWLHSSTVLGSSPDLVVDNVCL